MLLGVSAASSIIEESKGCQPEVKTTQSGKQLQNCGYFKFFLISHLLISIVEKVSHAKSVFTFSRWPLMAELKLKMADFAALFILLISALPLEVTFQM